MSAESLTPYELTVEMLASAFTRLTPRESEILHWLIHDKTDPEIAAILGICRFTVSKHVQHILCKLAVVNRHAASMEAVCVLICHRPPIAR